MKRCPSLPLRVVRSAWLLLALGALVDAAQAQLATYTARYQIEYRGRVAGLSEFAVRYDDARGVYAFSSRTRARGLLRLVSPRDVVEYSEFVVEDGRIRPLEFRYEDGSRRGDDNFRMVFDWNAGRVAVARSEDDLELELRPGVLDRGSMQVALMRDIEMNGRPGPYTLADENELTTYEFERQDDSEIVTAFGTFRAQGFLQRRAGSSRSTLLRVVPELRYLPAVIEQYRDGELNTRMVLESVEGLGPTGDGP